MTTYIGLAMSDTMFSDGLFRRETITPEEVAAAVQAGAVSALNPSHWSTIDVLQRRYGLKIPVPDHAPQIQLQPGDSLIVIQARLPRLAEGQVHSLETVESAPITFSRWQSSVD